MTLSKGQTIGKYRVVFPMSAGDYAVTYRVKDANGKNYCLKLIDLSILSNKQFDSNSNVIEMEIARNLKHPNIMHFVDSEELSLAGRRMAYLASDHISGENLGKKLARKEVINPYDIREWMLNVLAGVQYLHSLTDPIIHNELTPENIVLDAVNKRTVIVDFGHARHLCDDRRSFDRKGLSPYYLAPECIHGGIFSPQSDIFSIGVTAYTLLFGQLPWLVSNTDDFEEELQRQREKPLKATAMSNVTIPTGMMEVIARALSADPYERFRSAEEMADALKGEVKVGNHVFGGSTPTNRVGGNSHFAPAKKGNGFADVAGMRELKAQLQRDVINLLREPEKYKRYGLTLPNGMLLYGPPGCGKTFFAKKLAEEVGFNFLIRTPSDLQSRYINATQENIAAMFREAEANAPTIIFIDEINELLPKRTTDVHEMYKGAVNEMLAQMDRTGERGIFVIGATNLPDDIDEAMLRTGRLEKRFFVGPPDKEARQELFEKYLAGRYVDFGISHERLAELTEGNVSSDIRYLVDEAARKALNNNEMITMQILEETIRTHKPSISITPKRKIGF